MELENGVTILIIDDDEVIRDSCTKALVKEGYQVESASDGVSGCRKAKQIHPDLAIVDLKMPGLSGPEILEELARIDPYMAKVVITGYATVDTAVDSLQHGASHFLSKPFLPDELRKVTRMALEKRKEHLKEKLLRYGTKTPDSSPATVLLHEIEGPLKEIEDLFSQLDSREIIPHDLRGSFIKARTNLQELIQVVKKWQA